MFSKTLSFKVIKSQGCVVNPLPSNKILDQSNMKDFADDKINMTYKMNFVIERVENIVRKGENAVYQHLLLLPQCFKRPLCQGYSVKSQ